MTSDDCTVAVVTGANTGIGQATAHALAAGGAQVILACRSTERAQPAVDAIRAATGNDAVSSLALDLASLASVRRAAAELLARDEPIHLLVNNAGVAGQRGLTEDGFELAFGINHLGHFLLTTLLLDRLAASGPARVVNVSSGNHLHPKTLDLATVREPTRTFLGLREYDRSKLCNVLFTIELAQRSDPATLTTFSCNPGPVASDVWRRMPRPVRAVFMAVRRMKTNEEGAQPSLHAATAEGIEPDSGGYFDQDCRLRAMNPIATPELAAELWRRSEGWVQTRA